METSWLVGTRHYGLKFQANSGKSNPIWWLYLEQFCNYTSSKLERVCKAPHTPPAPQVWKGFIPSTMFFTNFLNQLLNSVNASEVPSIYIELLIQDDFTFVGWGRERPQVYPRRNKHAHEIGCSSVCRRWLLWSRTWVLQADKIKGSLSYLVLH